MLGEVWRVGTPGSGTRLTALTEVARPHVHRAVRLVVSSTSSPAHLGGDAGRSHRRFAHLLAIRLKQRSILWLNKNFGRPGVAQFVEHRPVH